MDDRFFGLIQAGFRELLLNWHDYESVYHNDSDSDSEDDSSSPKPSQGTSTTLGISSQIPPLTLSDTEDMPSTPPRTTRRSLSRVASAGAEIFSGTDGRKYAKPNPWTTVSPSWKPQTNVQAPASPTRTGKGKGKKRDRSQDGVGTVAKKGRRYVA